MNILIVDDNKNNRLMLKLLIEDYIEDKNLNHITIKEAQDGAVALNLARETAYDLIFMDILMPNMDGIEATKAIKAINSKSMIIAVSAVDEGEEQKIILAHGAEDYISKPINADVFVSRFTNYLTLIEARNHKKENRGSINLFTHEIYNRHINFIVNSEDSLSEFWEYFLLNEHEKFDNISDVVRTLFSIAEAQIKLDIESNIYVENSEDQLFFTLTQINKIPSIVLKLLIKKNNLMQEYKISYDKISIVLNQIKITSKDTLFQKESPALEVREIEEVSSLVYEESKELETFDYIDDDDLYDLEEYISKLNSLMLLVGNSDISYDDVREMSVYLEKISSILSTYSEVYEVSQVLFMLSKDIERHKEVFVENSQSLAPVCKAFSKDMSNWVQQTFYTGAPSVDFMNDTIKVNCQTIGSMLKMDEVATNEDLDDIFDF